MPSAFSVRVPYWPMKAWPIVPVVPRASLLMAITDSGSPSGSKSLVRTSPVGSMPAWPLATPPRSTAMLKLFWATGGSFTPRTVMTSCARSVKPLESVIW
ncbi:hypothetical protein D9M72_612820 [compost metagenome]